MNNKTKLRLVNGAIALCVLAAVGSGAALLLRGRAKEQNDNLLESLAAMADGLSGGGSPDGAESPDGAGSPGDGGGSDSPHAGSGEKLPGNGPPGDPLKKGSLPSWDTVTASDVLSNETIESWVLKREDRLAGYQALKAENQDMTGWITVPGTRIDYPVMQSVNTPDYYLKHDFERKKSSYGIPYAAEHCDLEAGCPNVVIYGHHMKNGSMFAGLMRYTEHDFWEQHPLVWFDTLKESGVYQIIGVVKASASAADNEEDIFRLAYADSEEEYKTFIEELKRRSLYDTGLTANYGDPLVTLITCEYTRDEGRLLVVARKMEI